MVDLDEPRSRAEHTPDSIGSSIEFCPETGAMTIKFFGGRFTGLPAWSLELLALAAGASSVHIDLSEVDLADPVRTERIFRSVLESDHGLTEITFKHRMRPLPAGSSARRAS